MGYRTAVVVLVLAAVGCATEPAPTLDVSGTFVGSTFGIQQGRRLDLNLSLALTQHGGTLSGTYVALGRWRILDPFFLDYESTVTGTVGSGDTPLVGIVLLRSSCPGYRAHFGGHYGTDSVLTIQGPFDIFESGSCSIATSYPITISMTRPPPPGSAVSRP